MQAETGTEFEMLRKRAGVPVKDLPQLLDCCGSTISNYRNGKTAPKEPALRILRQIIEQRTAVPQAKPAFTFIDLFAGIGGLRRAFEPLGGRCVMTSEWDKYAVATYKQNYSECRDHVFEGDITKVDPASIPDHDLLLAGFPCQPFSIAGVSKKNALGRSHGFACETQGTLFFNIERIIEEKRPRAFLLENVKNLVNHDRGRTFEIIMRTLREKLGYHVPRPRVIDAKSYLPQHRERIIIVGFREKNDFDLHDIDVPSPLSGPKLGQYLHSEDGSEPPDPQYTGHDGKVLPKYVLTEHLWTYLQKYAENHKAKGNGFGFGLVGRQDVARTLSQRYYKDGSEILVNRGAGQTPRRLTPRECSRIMGFDGPGEATFRIPVSDTQAYRQFGNSVAVPVVRAVARHMVPYLVSTPEKDAVSDGAASTPLASVG